MARDARWPGRGRRAHDIPHLGETTLTGLTSTFTEDGAGGGARGGAGGGLRRGDERDRVQSGRPAERRTTETMSPMIPVRP